MSNASRRAGPRDALVPRVLELLRKHRGGLTKQELRNGLGTVSAVTVQRLLNDLRDHWDAPVSFDRAAQRWVLADPSFTIPLEDPEPDDVRAALLAEAMLSPLADPELRDRLRRLTEHLDDKLRKRAKKKGTLPSASVLGWGSLVTKTRPVHLSRLLQALRRHPIRIEYYKPWDNERSRYTVEPFGICILDGAIYFRGWVRESGALRTFRLAQVERLDVREHEGLSQPLPGAHQVWAGHAPAFGIDQDRPGEAVLRVRGGTARWLSRITWHPAERDRWIVQDELLERTIPYNSVREMARRIATVLDGVVSIEPPQLREQVDATIAQYQARRVETLPASRSLARVAADAPVGSQRGTEVASRAGGSARRKRGG